MRSRIIILRLIRGLFIQNRMYYVNFGYHGEKPNITEPEIRRLYRNSDKSTDIIIDGCQVK